MSIQPSTLHYTAALLYAATVPKHTLVGLNKIDPAVQTIFGAENDKAKKLLTPTWMHCNLWLITSALMSYKWAKTGGPKGTEEKAIVWAQVAFGILTGYQYYKHDMYPGLACLWGAPAATVAAMMMTQGASLT